MTSSQHHVFSAWLDLVWPSSRDSKKLGFPSNITPLYIAAWSGMTTYARHLLDEGATAHCNDGQYMIPLSWAALKGHNGTVALLISHDPQSGYGAWHAKPLHFAAQANHHDIVKQLLEAGASPLAMT